MKRNLILAHGQAFAALRKCMILFTLLLTVGLSAKAAEFEVGGLRYNVTSETDRTVEVCGFVGEPVDVVIPENVENGGVQYGVISIGNLAFEDCTSLASVTIPNSVTSIGENAFSGCESLSSVTIPNSVTSIGVVAFSACSSLEEILVDAGNPNFSSDNGILYNKDMTELIECPGAKKEVVIPSTVTSILAGAFYGCSSLASVTIPSSVTSIGISAFYKCTSLASVTIPNSVTSIGQRAFWGCKSLASVTIPNSVTSIGLDVFPYCSSLEEIVVDANNPNYSSDNGILYNKDMTELIQCPGAKKEVVIPNTVTSIGQRAFADCESLASVSIPNSVTSIGNYAFADCESLASVSIPNSVTSTGNYAFWYCTSLASVTIPNSVTSIGRGAFWYCTSLASVTIPNSVTSIENAAFIDCTSLTSVTIPNSVTSIGDIAFCNCSSLKTIYSQPITPPTAGDYAFLGVPEDAVVYVPEGTVAAYSAAKEWSRFFDFREMTSGVSELPAGSEARPADVYNMQGMLVKARASQADIDALAPGLYIIAGRKVLVK